MSETEYFQKLERAVKFGLMPFEIAELMGRDIPLKDVAPIYHRHYANPQELNDKFEKRILRGTGVKRTAKSKHVKNLNQTIRQHIMARGEREEGN